VCCVCVRACVRGCACGCVRGFLGCWGWGLGFLGWGESIALLVTAGWVGCQLAYKCSSQHRPARTGSIESCIRSLQSQLLPRHPSLPFIRSSTPPSPAPSLPRPHTPTSKIPTPTPTPTHPTPNNMKPPSTSTPAAIPPTRRWCSTATTTCSRRWSPTGPPAPLSWPRWTDTCTGAVRATTRAPCWRSSTRSRWEDGARGSVVWGGLGSG